MDPLDLVGLRPLMARGEGRSEVVIGLIDGPVALGHPDLAEVKVHEVPGPAGSTCSRADSVACTHATFVAGILVAKRGSQAAAICPGCTLLIRPIFAETTNGSHQMPSAEPGELATAIIDSVGAGARVINLSAALAHPSTQRERTLEEALDYAFHRGVIVVAAAGNQASVGSSVITRHPAVIPVAACDLRGRPLRESNLGNSISRRGLLAPGEGVISLGTNGGPQTSGGTSAAAPFVTGTIALLCSEFPSAGAAEITRSMTQLVRQRNTIVPSMLDAWAAYQMMAAVRKERKAS